MKELAPNTPVIVGIGFEQETFEDPTQCAEPWRLMVRAVRRAAADAGSETPLAQIESISVPQGMWEYRNPGRLIADALGCPSARSILSDLGVLQLSLLSDLCRAIAAGEQQVGVITGGEAKFRELRGVIVGQPVANTKQPQDTPLPDVHHTSSDPWASELEARIKKALATLGRPGVRKIAEQFGVDPGTVQRISRPFEASAAGA